MMKSLILILCILTQTAFAETKASMKLLTAIEKNNLTLAQNAITEGADPNAAEALIKAVEHNRPSIVGLLLSHHADVNVRRPTDHYTPLMMAALTNNSSIARSLISQGADVNLESLLQKTALHITAARNSTEVAQVLLSAKDIDVNANTHLCALAVAAREGHLGMVLLLKKQIGSKASSPLCLEKAILLAQKKHFDQIVLILSR